MPRSECSHAERLNLVDDDGQTLWISPTDGQPLDLAYLPPGVQIIVALRPGSWRTTLKAKKSSRPSGPVVGRAWRY